MELKLKEVVDSTNTRYFVLENDTIAYTIQKYGSWEGHLVSLYKSFIKEGNVVIDVGANFGYHTVHFSKLVGTAGRVISFEPYKLMYDILSANILINGASNRVIQNNYGLSDEDKNMFLCGIDSIKQGDTSFVNWGGIHLTDETNGTEEVYVKRLDDIFNSHVDFLKVDIEGMEINFLRGAYRTISESLPIIFMEISQHTDDIYSYLFELGYVIFRIENWSSKMDNVIFHSEKHKEIIDFFRSEDGITKLNQMQIEISEINNVNL